MRLAWAWRGLGVGLAWAWRDPRTHKTIRCRSAFTSRQGVVSEWPSVPTGNRNVRNQSKER